MRFGNEDRCARRAGFGDHVDRIGRDDDAVGEGQRTGVEVLAIALVRPDQAESFAITFAHEGRQFRRCARRSTDHQVAAFACELVFELAGQHFEGAAAERHGRRGAAEQHGRARAGQGTELRESRACSGQPGLVDRIQAALAGQHVRAGQAVVFRCDHEIPMLRRDARMQDLHHLRAAFVQQARRQRRQSAAADGVGRRIGKQIRECRAERPFRAGPAPRRQPAGEAPGGQREFARAQAQCLRQGQRLAAMPAASVVQ